MARSGTLAFACVLAGALCAAPAFAQEQEDSFMAGLMSAIGLKGQNERGIDYRERSPLVIPSKRDLPSPEAASAAKDNPNWPVDPDQKKVTEEGPALTWEEIGRPLRPDQMMPGRKSSKVAKETTSGDNLDPGRRLSPSELGYKGGIFSGLFGKSAETETGTFVSEPTRGNLTQPPPGYQTPSPASPYGLGKAAPGKAENPMDRGTKQQ